MFDGNYDDTAGRYELSSITAIRDAALIMYGRFLAHLYGVEPTDDKAKTRHKHLSLQETENIVREHATCFADGTYAIGGDTAEEANEKINELLAALMDRVMSNVLSAGVKDGLIDCSYDADVDDFTFNVTAKGQEIVKEIREARNRSETDTDRADISGNQEV